MRVCRLFATSRGRLLPFSGSPVYFSSHSLSLRNCFSCITSFVAIIEAGVQLMKEKLSHHEPTEQFGCTWTWMLLVSGTVQQRPLHIIYIIIIIIYVIVTKPFIEPSCPVDWDAVILEETPPIIVEMFHPSIKEISLKNCSDLQQSSLWDK